MSQSEFVAADTRETGQPARFDVDKIRLDFPILHQEVYGKPLAYLDNAATAQKPRAVIDAVSSYYEETNSNIHRGVHKLSEQATAAYEKVRKQAAQYLGAAEAREIIFLRGTTEAINLVVNSYGRSNIGEGDEIVISQMEHHSNIVPWQILCQTTGAVLKVIPMNDAGELMMDEYEKLLGDKTKFVSVVHVSNSLGTINPVKRIIDLAHERKIPVMLDAAQSTPHMRVDVQALDCDFCAFSGHKVFGPTGIGVLYGKRELLEAMPPFHGGGDMIKYVSFEKTIYNDLPYKFEAGTPNIAGVVGLGAAFEYLEALDDDALVRYEHELLEYGTALLKEIPGLRVIGTAREKASVISFVIDDIHSHDIGTFVDREGVAIRVGHHCTQPVMQHFGIPATSRASFAWYNTHTEIDRLADALNKVIDIFG